MITTSKHFHSDVFIPNLKGCINVYPALKIQIGIFEKEALINALGVCLADELLNQFEYDSDEKIYNLKPDTDEKWVWLLNGRTYEYDGSCCFSVGCCGDKCKKFVYPGIIQELEFDPTTQFEKNYLAYYIYYHFQTINESLTSGSGEKVVEAINSIHVYNKKKRYNAWNRWADWVETLSVFLKHHEDEYPEANISCGVQRKNIWDV